MAGVDPVLAGHDGAFLFLWEALVDPAGHPTGGMVPGKGPLLALQEPFLVPLEDREGGFATGIQVQELFLGGGVCSGVLRAGWSFPGRRVLVVGAIAGASTVVGAAAIAIAAAAVGPHQELAHLGHRCLAKDRQGLRALLCSGRRYGTGMALRMALLMMAPIPAVPGLGGHQRSGHCGQAQREVFAFVSPAAWRFCSVRWTAGTRLAGCEAGCEAWSLSKVGSVLWSAVESRCLTRKSNYNYEFFVVLFQQILCRISPENISRDVMREFVR